MQGSHGYGCSTYKKIENFFWQESNSSYIWIHESNFFTPRAHPSSDFGRICSVVNHNVSHPSRKKEGFIFSLFNHMSVWTNNSPIDLTWNYSHLFRKFIDRKWHPNDFAIPTDASMTSAIVALILGWKSPWGKVRASLMTAYSSGVSNPGDMISVSEIKRRAAITLATLQ